MVLGLVVVCLLVERELELRLLVVRELVVFELEQRRVVGHRRLELHDVELNAGARRLSLRATDSQSRVTQLVALLAAAAVLAAAVAAPSAIATVRARPVEAGIFLLLSLVFQLLSVEVYGKGTIGISAIAKLAAGFSMGPGVAIAIAIATALFNSARRRAPAQKWVFDAATWALAAGAATVAYRPFASNGTEPILLVGATLAGAVYSGLNLGLVCLVMSQAESAPFASVWRERFHWARYHFLGYGLLALALTLAHQKLGITGVAAFALPPMLAAASVRQYLKHTHRAVEEVRAANERMRRAHRDTTAALTRSIAAKDDYTGRHTERVAEIAVAIARRLGYRGDDLHAIEIGALLHDVGKIGIPEHVLSKPAPLDDDEWQIMKRHPIVSDYILADTELHPFVRQIARSSHERIDGTGYPDGLAGEEIPLPARIVFVADAFDALTTDRPYRAARSVDAALAELREHAGTQFCPRAVATLEQVQRAQPRLLRTPPEEEVEHAA